MATLKFPSLTFSSFLTQTNRKYTHTWWFVYNLLATPMQPCQVLKLNMFYRAARQNVRVEHMLSFSLTKDLNLHARNLLRDLLLQFSAVQVHYMHALTYIRNFQEHFPVVFQYVYVRVYIEVNHIQLLYILGSDNLYKLNFTGVGRQNVRWLPSCMCRTISRLGGGQCPCPTHILWLACGIIKWSACICFLYCRQIILMSSRQLKPVQFSP